MDIITSRGRPPPPRRRLILPLSKAHRWRDQNGLGPLLTVLPEWAATPASWACVHRFDLKYPNNTAIVIEGPSYSA